MPYQNLGIITQADVTSRVSLTWPDIRSQATARFKDTFDNAPPYTQAYIKSGLWSRVGPGTGYGNATYYNQGYVLRVTGQFGNWLQLSTGDYIPISQTADYPAMVAAQKAKAAAAAVVTDNQIKTAIATATPTAIGEIVGGYTFSAAGISTAVVTDLVKRVKDRIIFHAFQALGGTPER